MHTVMSARWLFPASAVVALCLACGAAALSPSGGAAELDVDVGGALVRGGNGIMSRRAHGSTEEAPMASLRWGADWKVRRRPLPSIVRLQPAYALAPEPLVPVYTNLLSPIFAYSHGLTSPH